MKFKHITYSVTVAALGLFTACEPEIEREIIDGGGEADFSVYVALGNSLTAGYADGALNRHGQINSYPAIIADKMAAVTSDFHFVQPLLPAGIANGTLEFKGLTQSGTPNIVPASGGLTEAEIFAPVEGPFNNLGVPGAKVAHLLAPGYPNPYFTRFASSQTASVIEDAVALNPTFFTLWIGNNDVLGYASSGGSTGVITPVEEFEAAYQGIINQLTGSNSQIEGALANIPGITKTPLFTTVKYNQLVLSADQAAQANAAYSAMIDPQIRASVDSVAKTQIIRGVIEAGARREIEAQARPLVAQGVATEIVYLQAYEGARNQGLSEAEAQAYAENYITTEEGQAKISGLANQLLNDEAPAEAQAAFDAELANQVEITFNSEGVQAEIEAAYQASINNMDNLEAVLGAEGAAAVDSVFNTPEVVAQREAGFQQTVAGFQQAGFYPVFAEGPNPFVIEDENPMNPLGIREMRSDELILLTALAEGQLTPENAALPKADQYILDVTEIAEVQAAIEAYNDIIENIAQENTFALVDMNSFFDEVADGYTVQGLSFNAQFITGNAFSLDGIHLTQRGYALVAKKFIDEINEFYNADIPEPKLANYPTLGLPGPVVE
ncbi:SGNH/GDSL hydrolase family protein [Nafulsella turpanensis]|uniref:SGNH/GDSL hydrolase family protein n=1 Tax=Nafulsella turpanensis TaxID=1265690 RepID=UPI00034C3E4A|nr:SGNH/GDSL hydrolase family protein [Nafulsella turpanensis]